MHKSNKRSNKKYRSKTIKFRPMNCSPTVKGKTPVAESCFTDEILFTLKEYYNKHHKENGIVATDPKGIWIELKNKLSTCSKEDCWLSEIDDPLVRTKIDQFIFAPDRPSDWKTNAWLSNLDIVAVLRQYEKSNKNFKILGPTPINFDSRLPELNGSCVWEDLCNFSLSEYLAKGITKLGVVFNLDKYGKKGSHWVSMFMDLEDKFIFYLDSAGDRIKKPIHKFVKRVIKQAKELPEPMKMEFYQNCPTEHQMGESECGMYALYFIITMLTGETEKLKFINADDKIKFFKNKRIPDQYVNKYRKIYFNSG